MINRTMIASAILAVSNIVAADAPSLRVTIHAEADNGLSGKLVSLMSKEMRHLEGVVVTDDSPQYRLSCSVITLDLPNIRAVGYAASVAVTSADGHLLIHFVHADNSLDSLAHEVALTVDGGVLERARRGRPPDKPQQT